MRTLTLLTTLALVLTACKTDTASTSTPTTTTPTTTTTADAPPTLQEGVLTIAMEGTYPPFTFRDEGGELTGFDVDVARAIAGKLGLQTEFVLTEWSGILGGLQADKYDVIVNQVGITPERQESIGLSEPYAYSQPQIIVPQKGNFTPETLADLKGRRVGVGLGSNFEQQLRDAGGIEVVTYPGAPEYLADLAAGRIDAAYNDRLLVGYLINRDNLPILNPSASPSRRRTRNWARPSTGRCKRSRRTEATPGSARSGSGRTWASRRRASRRLASPDPRFSLACLPPPA
jgi:cystine transport system substrate-binding protein